MDIRSQFTNRYKKDLSTEYIRTKVARRKSISQKENRHNEFKKSRGLSLADVNISIVKECELPSLEEVTEISVSKGNEKADGCKIKDKMLNERRELLLRFKEEKQLRKLKEQREKASRGIFKCGVYKPDDTLAPVVSSQTTSKAKPKEKPLPPTATRVTRSMAKVEPTIKKTTRPQQTMATVFNSSKNTSERSIPKGRGQSATAKKPDKENKVLTAPLATRAAALTGSKLPSRNTTVSRPQKNIIKEKTNQTINQQAETVEKSIAVSKPVLEEDVTQVVLKDDAMRNLEDLKKERKPSFAPQNFTFQPLDGLAPFKFQPRTPPSMPNDATSCFTWSPMRSESRNAAILDIPESLPHEDCERVLDQMPSVEQSPKPDSSELQMDTHSSTTEAKECTNEECPVISDSVTPETHESVTETAPNENVPAAPAEEPEHDVPYFRNILKSEILRLTAMCTQWEEKFEIDIPEEAKDLIRTTVGQTRLLIAERFKQFEGLVDNCEFKRGEKETTCTDLEGFWDMVYFQIEDVTNKFANLNKLEENAWQQSTVQTKKVVRKKVVAAPSAKPNQGNNGKAAARSRLAAIKAALKNKGKKEEAVLETASSECIMQVDKVVFEAGFFRIESPAKVVNSLRKSNRFSQTPKSIIKLQECLENPVTDVLSTAEETKVNSPVRKILFDTEKESVQESCQMAADVDNTEAECVSHVASLEEKYLVPVQCLSLEPEECFVVGEIYSLKDGSEVSHCVSATIVDSLVDDVFMRSPEKVLQPIAIAETPVLCADKEVKNSSSPLDFLGSSTPSHQTEVNCCPLKFDSVVAIDDLIVFSPADK